MFHRYLDIARSSTFENANITIILARRNIIGKEQEEDLLEKLDHLCRKITNFQKAL
jgi:four helix bundle protein